MQRALSFFLILFIHVQGNCQQTLSDSAWFEEYYTRVSTLRDYQDPSAFDSLEIVKSIADKKNYLPAIGRYYIEKAGQYLSEKKTDSAIISFQEAITLAGKNNLDRLSGNAYLGLANLHQFSGNTIEAAKNYLEAAKLLKKLGRKRLLIGIYRNLHTIHSRLQQKNGVLKNMLTTVVTDKSNEKDLVEIINTKTSEEEGFHFANQNMVKEVGADAIYVIFGDAKFLVSDFETLGRYGSMRDVQRIPAGTLYRIPNIPRDGSLVMEYTGDPKVYLVKNGTLYHILNTDVLENYGGWDAVYFLPSGVLKDLPKSAEQVTPENMTTIFNINQVFDNLADSISAELIRNERLSNELSQKVSERNATLQKRNTLLWVSAVSLLALLLIVFLLVRNFRQKQKLNAHSMTALRKEQEVQRKMEVEKERTRIATDMHDDLGAGLSRIKFLSETIGIKKQKQLPIEEDINSIRQYSHEMIDKMGEIVWALNEKNDSLMDLLAYTRSYAVEYLSEHGIKCIVTMPENFPSLFVSGEFRRNIYLCVKEVLHNVVKHAQASQVTFDIGFDPELELVITDDGNGFDPAKTRVYSNGLNNIKKRMKDIGGVVRIENKGGTRINLSAPLPL